MPTDLRRFADARAILLGLVAAAPDMLRGDLRGVVAGLVEDGRKAGSQTLLITSVGLLDHLLGLLADATGEGRAELLQSLALDRGDLPGGDPTES